MVFYCSEEICVSAWGLSHDRRGVPSPEFNDIKGLKGSRRRRWGSISISIHNYRPFEDVSDGFRRLIDFLGASLPDEGRRLVRLDDDVFEVTDGAGKRVSLVTTSRSKAADREDLELIGLDHPLVEAELAKWRDIDAAEIGACVTRGRASTALLAMWLIEASNAKNERKTSIQSIAVDAQTGVRIPSAERQIEEMFRSPEGTPALSPNARSDLFRQMLEPALERELKMKGVLSEDGSFSADLIGLVELV